MTGMRIEHGWLRSRVARRVFLVFLVSACLPIALFATYSLVRVAGQLRDQADRQLHRSVKATGMTLVERLDLAALDLRNLGETLPVGSGGGERSEIPPTAGALAERLATRFTSVKILAADGRERVLLGTGFSGPELDPWDWGALGEGRLLVRSVVAAGTEVSAAILVPLPHLGATLVGKIAPEFLWPEEGMATLSTLRLCLDADGNRLYPAVCPDAIPDLAAQVRSGETSGRFTWSTEDERWIGRYWRVFMKYQFEEEWIVFEAAPESEVLAPVREFRIVFALVAALSICAALVFSSLQIRKQLVPIERLQEATRRIAAGRFDEPVGIATGDEFEELGRSFETMAVDLGQNLRLRRALIDLGIALTAESREKDLLRILLRGTREILGCGASGVGILDPKGSIVAFLFETCDGEVRTFDAEALQAVGSTVGRIDSLSGAAENRCEERDRLTELLGRPLRAPIGFPLRDHESGKVGFLLAADPLGGGDELVSAFPPESAQLGHLLAAQASAALTQRRLLDGFKQLFDGMSQLIATAIDEKSPYTYGHCQRVPIVTMMLADALSRTNQGPFATFELTADERYELEIAALLHDCGKVTTPVHVVDKATKLETIFDRIELIRMRFEIVARDRVIERLGGQVSAPAPLSAPPELSGWDRDLVDDFAFLQRSNVGSEYLSAADKERIRAIGSSNRFVDGMGETRPLLTTEEVDNLCISRGTLNDGERKIIQDHVVASIRMLDMLPYPRNLARVPLIAGAHHERMDGKGYPRGIRLGELPLQARILALADVFEALTAKDRPYKDGKTLGEALTIMARMRMDGHLDPDLFDFFLASGVYLDYAERYLEPRQLDPVDVTSLPGCSHLQPILRAA